MTTGMALPLMMIPGLQGVGGGLLSGALMGALQPTVEGESRGINTALGAGIGGLTAWGGNTLAGALERRAGQPLMGYTPETAPEIAAQSFGAKSVSNKTLERPTVACNRSSIAPAVQTLPFL